MRSQNMKYTATMFIVMLLAGAHACGNNPRKDGSRLNMDSSVHPTDSSSVRETANALDSVRVTIQLRDGSKILGYPLPDSLTFQTQYANFRLALNLVRTIEFSATKGMATASLVNGERLLGMLDASTFPVRSLVGVLSIPVRDISSIIVIQQAGLPDSGLVAFYPFHGDATDKSGHGHDGTVNGARLTNDRFGNANSAYAFDGNDSYISIPDGIVRYDAGAFTISTWLFMPAIDKHRIAMYLGASKGEVVLQIQDRRIAFTVNIAGNTVYHVSAAGPVNSWIHVVGVYRRGQQTEIWINGEQKNQMPIPEGDLIHTYPTHNSTIGSYAPTWIDHKRQYDIRNWLGSITQVRIYDRALESGEIQSLFTLSN